MQSQTLTSFHDLDPGLLFAASQATELQMVYDLVWGFRRSAGDVWVWPGVLECLRYVEDEAIEARDAYRRSRLDHFRNNARGEEVEPELADVAIMAASAYPHRWDWDRVLLSCFRRRGLHHPVFDSLDALESLDFLVDHTHRARRAWQLCVLNEDHIEFCWWKTTPHLVNTLALILTWYERKGIALHAAAGDRLARIGRKVAAERARRAETV